jgi:hypothetical protein
MELFVLAFTDNTHNHLLITTAFTVIEVCHNSTLVTGVNAESHAIAAVFVVGGGGGARREGGLVNDELIVAVGDICSRYESNNTAGVTRSAAVVGGPLNKPPFVSERVALERVCEVEVLLPDERSIREYPRVIRIMNNRRVIIDGEDRRQHR